MIRFVEDIELLVEKVEVLGNGMNTLLSQKFGVTVNKHKIKVMNCKIAISELGLRDRVRRVKAEEVTSFCYVEEKKIQEGRCKMDDTKAC